MKYREALVLADYLSQGKITILDVDTAEDVVRYIFFHKQNMDGKIQASCRLCRGLGGNGLSGVRAGPCPECSR